jgi:glycosyltransferase involved in cell wall biosynthesis
MLIESAAKMNIVGPAFVIVGDGHLRAGLEAQAKADGLNGRVIFTGFRDDASSLYADFDIAALTSLNEGTPLTLIEAMSCGCAVASTEVGGVADLMGRRRETLDGFTVWDHGVTAPSRDVKAFTNGLRYLIERPDLRRDMGERGRAFVLSMLSKERLIGDIENLYCDLIAEAS